MSWFHETEVYVDVITNKLTDADTTPLKNAVISASVQDGDVTNYVLAGMVNGLAARARRYWRYGEKEKFIDGLPEVTLGINNNYPETGFPEEPIPFPGSFYPIASIRKDGQFLTKDDADRTRYDSTRKLLKRIALKLRNIVDTIEKPRDDEPGENPAANLDDVFYLFGLDLYTQHPESIGYMYDFCELLHEHMQMSEEQFNWAKAEFTEPTGGSTPHAVPSNAIFINEQESDFQIIINFDYVWHSGILNGLCINPNPSENPEGKVANYASVTHVAPEELTRDDGGGGGGIRTTYVDPSDITYFKQLTRVAWGDAEDTYAAWGMKGPTHETHVLAYGAEKLVFRSIGNVDNVGGQSSGTYDKFHGLVIGDPNYGRSGIYFPLCKEILELRHTMQEEEVLVDAMMLAMHAAEEVELEWYQQTWFKIVMVILVAVLMYFQLHNLAAEAWTLTEAATFIVTQLGVGYLAELIAKEVGGDLGIALAAAFAIYAVSKGDFSGLNKFMPHAEELLQTVKVVSTVAEAKIQQDVGELIEDSEAFNDKAQTREQAIKEAWVTMGANQEKFDFLNLLLEDSFNTSYLRENEDYDWATKSNMADVVKSSISEYHSRMTKLPDVNDTLNKQTA